MRRTPGRVRRLLGAGSLCALAGSSGLVATAGPGAPSPAAGAATPSATFGFGSNGDGQLGNGTTTDADTPTAVDAPTDGAAYSAVAAGGGHTVALGSDGHVYTWGYNTWGQLGNGTTTSSSTPVSPALPGGTYTAVSAGTDQSFALSSNGTLYAWGLNDDGQLGIGSTASTDTPTAVSAPAGVTFTAVSAGAFHTVALASNGDVYDWGSNSSGQLGDSTQASSNMPVQAALPGGATATAVAAGGAFTLALGKDGNVYAWGSDASGQLGNGAQSDRSIPVTVTMPSGVTGFTAIAAGNSFALALASRSTGGNGKLYAWGDDTLDQLGNQNGVCSDGTNGCSPVPVQPLNTGALAFSSISAGYGQGYAVSTTAAAYGWGDNYFGQIAQGSTGNLEPTPVTIALPGGAVPSALASGPAASFAFALTTTPTPGAPAPYEPLPPVRLLDTRTPGEGGPFGSGVTRSLQVTGVDNVPADAAAVVLNVTVTGVALPPGDTSSYLSVFPAGQAVPGSSTLNFGNAETVANLTEVGVGTGGQVSIYNHLGSTNVIVDLEGYVAPTGSGASSYYYPVPPNRVLDTRGGTGEDIGTTSPAVPTKVAGNPLQVTVEGPVKNDSSNPVPSSSTVTAVVLNLTATDTSQASWLTVWPDDGSKEPTASNVNFAAGQTVPNRVIVRVGPGGVIDIADGLPGQTSATADVIADVSGYFTSTPTSMGRPGLFFAAAGTPTRLVDTRQGSGNRYANQTVVSGTPLMVHGTDTQGIPLDARVLEANVTATNPSASGWLTVWPDTAGPSPQPATSDVNYAAGETVPNMDLIEVAKPGTSSPGTAGAFNVGAANHIPPVAGSVRSDVIVDVGGWYVPPGG